MAEIDKQKEKVAFWRNLFFFILASVFGLVGYLFTHYKTLEAIEIAVVDIAIFGLVISLVFIAKKMIKETEKLKDL